MDGFQTTHHGDYTMNYRDVLRELAEERRRMADELAGLLIEDPDLLVIPPRELQLIELAGYTVDLRTGTVEPCNANRNGQEGHS